MIADMFKNIWKDISLTSAFDLKGIIYAYDFIV